MLLPLSEPVPLLPGVVARVEQVRQSARTPVPARFLHFHGPAELVLIEAGSGHLFCEGSCHGFTAGTVLFVPSMAVHDFAFAAGKRAWTLIQFDPYAISHQAIALPPGPLSAAADRPTFARLEMLARWLQQTAAEQGPTAAMAIQLQALLLAAVQTFDPGQLNERPAASGLSRFRPLLDQLARDSAPILQLHQAATLCAMSPSYFSRRFKRAFGTGFIDYQSRLKLQQAARILATSDAPVSQIAYRLGFRSHAYFSHCFKAEFGVAPSRSRSRALSSADVR